METTTKTIYDANQDAVAELWPEFESLIPDNESAVEHVLQKLFEYEMIRCHCGNQEPENFARISLRILACRQCSREIRFLARTCFRYVKQLKAWLGAIYLKERRVLITSYRLTRLCNIAFATAHNIVTTLAYHLQKELELKPSTDVYSAPLNSFIKILFRRSLISASYKHPSEPPDESNRNNSQTQTEHESQRFSGSSESARDCAAGNIDIDLTETDMVVFDAIQQMPISQDSLCIATEMNAAQVSAALVMLEVSGLIEALPGNLFIRCKQRETPSSSGAPKDSLTAIGFRAFLTIREIYGGVSRKYLQLYLAAFWCHLDSVRWHQDSLLKILLRGKSIQFQEVLSYVSPLTVSIMPSGQAKLTRSQN